ncbi:MAG: hypothetical protein ACRDPG_01315, partial [Nocardioidaceae bacterium]
MLRVRVRLVLGLPVEGLVVAVLLGLAEAFDDPFPGVVPRSGTVLVEFFSEGFGGRLLDTRSPQSNGEDFVGAGRFAAGVFVAGGFGDDAGQVVVASSGHADVEVLGAGSPIHDEHALVDRHALSLVDRHGVRESDMLFDVVGGQGDLAAPVKRSELQVTASGAAGDLPAVTVSDPRAGGGDEAAVVSGG